VAAFTSLAFGQLSSPPKASACHKLMLIEAEIAVALRYGVSYVTCAALHFAKRLRSSNKFDVHQYN